MTTMAATTTQVYRIFIKATPEAIWEAITKPEFTEKYFYGVRIDTIAERRVTHAYDGSDTQRERILSSSSTRRGDSCTVGSRSGIRSCRPRSRAA